MILRFLFSLLICLISSNVSGQRYYNDPEFAYDDVYYRDMGYHPMTLPPAPYREGRPNVVINDYSTTNNYYDHDGCYTERDRVVTYKLREHGEVAQWTLNFDLGSTRMSAASMTNLINIERFANKYPDARFTIYAYADAGTGTCMRNYTLSEQRADMVLSLLVGKHYIRSYRFTVNCMGSDSQIYTNNGWNRCVLIKAFID